MTEERAAHIAIGHPELLPEHMELIRQTLADPDSMRPSRRMEFARLVSRWFADFRGGKHVVVVVNLAAASGGRNWILTAYITRNIAQGATLWTRNV